MKGDALGARTLRRGTPGCEPEAIADEYVVAILSFRPAAI
jgi:hypothetical protein